MSLPDGYEFKRYAKKEAEEIVNRIMENIEYTKGERSYYEEDFDSIIFKPKLVGKSRNLLDASAKKAPNWFTTKGLQLPRVVQTILDAYALIIQQNDDKSTPSEEKTNNFSTLKVTAQRVKPSNSDQMCFFSLKDAPRLPT